MGAARRGVDRAEDRAATDWADAVTDAVRRGDLPACAALVHDDVRVRVDGGEVASSATELLLRLDDALRGAPPGDDWLCIVDRHVAGDDVFVLFAATPPLAADAALPTAAPAIPPGGAGGIRGADRRLLGYAIAHVRDGRCAAVDCFLGMRRSTNDPAGPAAVIDLRGDAPVIDLREPELDAAGRREPGPAASERPAARGWRRFALPLAALASWVVQDFLLAAPVVAFAARTGTIEAFLVFAPLYAALSLVLSLFTVRLLSRGAAPRVGRLVRWLESGDHHPLAMRLLRAGGVLGFVLSSYLLSGPPTVWALHRFAVRRDLRRCAILTSVIWGVTFVLSYLVVAELVLL